MANRRFGGTHRGRRAERWLWRGMRPQYGGNWVRLVGTWCRRECRARRRCHDGAGAGGTGGNWVRLAQRRRESVASGRIGFVWRRGGGGGSVAAGGCVGGWPGGGRRGGGAAAQGRVGARGLRTGVGIMGGTPMLREGIGVTGGIPARRDCGGAGGGAVVRNEANSGRQDRCGRDGSMKRTESATLRHPRLLRLSFVAAGPGRIGGGGGRS